ncbi:MAG: 50S ribosomal protein L35 [Bacillota bacterium]
MPKIKTHSGTKKRVKVTASGKIKVSHANRAHLKSNKNKNTIRNNKKATLVSKADEKTIKQLLGNIK